MLLALNYGQEEKLKIDIQKYLKDHHKISTENGKLAIHLSENKRNLNSIKKNDNEVEVLIFKQAIALGWDCPRAQILALFRDWKTLNFSIQTLGRIIRMPQVKIGHYREEILNHSYVFTNIENIEMDTFSEEEFFYSYRRSLHNKEKDYGRCISVILMT